MYPFNFPFFTLIILASIFAIIQCQICDLKHGNLPQNWRCDDTPHILSQNKNEMDRYCGFTNFTSLPDPLSEHVSNANQALPGQLPFAAAIGYKGRHHCGAVLIDNYHLLTAAHCVLLVKYRDPNGNGVNPKDLKVQMGTIFRHGTNAADNDINRIQRDVSKIHRHPDYEQGYVDPTTKRKEKGGFGGSDIAVLTLVEPMPFTRNIWPICLSSKSLVIGNANLRGSPLSLSGFGEDKDKDIKHVTLQVTTELRLLEKEECKEAISNSTYEFKSGQLCTVGVKKEKTAGSCKGDSGGPLTISSSGRHYLLGIVSYGPGDCLKGSTTKPDVYSKTDYFYGWIFGITTKWEYSVFFYRSKFFPRKIL